jgi:hypothetical protein
VPWIVPTRLRDRVGGGQCLVTSRMDSLDVTYDTQYIISAVCNKL